MFSLPPSLKRLVKELSDLPALGPRQATRLALYLVTREPRKAALIAQALGDTSKIKTCERCFFIFDPYSAESDPATRGKGEGLCDICRNPNRDKGIIMVLEKETDLISIENTNRFKGRYLILGELPKTGLLGAIQKERLAKLRADVSGLPDGKAVEIILGFNPTSLGDFHASLIGKELAPLTLKLSRLGRGLPSGGEIEFADDETLGSALQSRGSIN